MSSEPTQQRFSWPRWLLASLTMAVPTLVPSQSAMNAIQTAAPGVVPLRLHADRYGRSGEECPRGFEQLAQACVAIKVPARLQ